jgi:hypothetical protein
MIPNRHRLSQCNPAFILTGPQYEEAFDKGKREAVEHRKGRLPQSALYPAWQRQEARGVRGEASGDYHVFFDSLNGLAVELDGYAFKINGRQGRDPAAIADLMKSGTVYVSLDFDIQIQDPTDAGSPREYFVTDDCGDRLTPFFTEGGNSPYLGDFDDVCFYLFDGAGRPLIARDAKQMTLHIVSHGHEWVTTYRLSASADAESHHKPLT